MITATYKISIFLIFPVQYATNSIKIKKLSTYKYLDILILNYLRYADGISIDDISFLYIFQGQPVHRLHELQSEDAGR